MNSTFSFFATRRVASVLVIPCCLVLTLILGSVGCGKKPVPVDKPKDQTTSTTPKTDGSQKTEAPKKDTTTTTTTPPKKVEQPTTTTKEETTTTTPDPVTKVNDHVVLTTDSGVIVLDLLEEDAPKHVANFKANVKAGIYKGLSFHRVIDGFIAQGGKSSKAVQATAIPSEAKVAHTSGSVAMVLKDQSDHSKGSVTDQFYICYQDWPELKGATVFAKVIQGMAVAQNFGKYSEGDDVESNNGTLPPEMQTKILNATIATPEELATVVARETVSAKPAIEARQKAMSLLKQKAEADSDVVAVLKTDLGDIVIDLFEKETPKHAENFKKHVKAGYYHNTTFHRVIKGFMAQGGDPEGTGLGGPGYTIEAEIGRPHVRGAVAAARTGDRFNPERRSSGSQFYICFNREGTANLDNQYTVFGQVIEGMDIVDKIKIGEGASFPVDQRTKILSTSLEPKSKFK